MLAFFTAFLAATVPPIQPVTVAETPGVENYRVSFSTDSNSSEALDQLIDEHRKQCLELDPAVCLVETFRKPAEEYRSGELKLRLSSGNAQPFINAITRSADNVAFQVNIVPERRRANSLAEHQLSVTLIEWQLLKLGEAAQSADRDTQRAATDRIARLTRELTSAQERADRTAQPFGAETVTISYTNDSGRGSSRFSRQINELLELFGLFALGAVGIAILTAIYFGIIGFALLKMRKWAVRLGLLKEQA